jgi:hypothetical protein
MSNYILPPEPASGSIVVFGKDGSGFPVTRGIGILWHRIGWRDPRLWSEVVAWHADDVENPESIEERIIVHVLRDGETV